MTLSDDGQWMWDGTQWVPAPSTPAPAPAAPPAQSDYYDPNAQSWDAPGQSSRFEQPAMTHNTGEWSPQSSTARSSSMPVAVIITIVILVVGGATGGILWATGVFGSSGDDLVGVWYNDDNRNGMQFKEDGYLVDISEGSPSTQSYDSFTWSVSGDKLTISITQHLLSDDFECNNGDTVPNWYVNDGEDDCEGGEDEGVDVTKYPHVTMSYSVEVKYEIEGDVLFIGLLKTIETEDGSVETNEILESKICTSEDSECSASVRASAMNNLNHATVVSGVTAPDWWVNTDFNDDDYDI